MEQLIFWRNGFCKKTKYDKQKQPVDLTSGLFLLSYFLMILDPSIVIQNISIRSCSVFQHCTGIVTIVFFTVPVNPSGSHVTILIEDIPLAINLFPGILRVSSVTVLIPPAGCIALPLTRNRQTACLSGTDCLHLVRIVRNNKKYGDGFV